MTLEGIRVRLCPLSTDHTEELCAAGLYESLWRFVPTMIRTREDMQSYVRVALKSQEEGTAVPFVILEKSRTKVVGSTRYANIDDINKRLEIGWTWLAPEWQQTHVNTESKYLLLRHAFEKLGCIRVEFKTDSLNEQSRNALQRIGAHEEGTFRNHMIMPDGRYRHSVYYSIIGSEWPEVKLHLERKMQR